MLSKGSLLASPNVVLKFLFYILNYLLMLLYKFCSWREESVVVIALNKLSMNVCGMELRKG